MATLCNIGSENFSLPTLLTCWWRWNKTKQMKARGEFQEHCSKICLLNIINYEVSHRSAFALLHSRYQLSVELLHLSEVKLSWVWWSAPVISALWQGRSSNRSLRSAWDSWDPPSKNQDHQQKETTLKLN